MNNDLISREALIKTIKAELDYASAIGFYMKMNRINSIDLAYMIFTLIDKAPTVDITEEQAIDKLHKTGWLPMHDKEMTEREK